MATIALPMPTSTTALTHGRFESQSDYRVTSSAALTTSRERSYTHVSKGIVYRVVVRDNSIPSWVNPTISAFEGIRSLRNIWDSYGGKAINNNLMQQSLDVLQAVMKENSPPPSVVPMADGGVQLEWHRRQQDLEIVFAADEAPQFFYTNRATGKEQQGFADEIGILGHLLNNLA